MTPQEARRESYQSRTVLLVDGVRDDRQMYAEYLWLQQFTVIQADNTADGLSRAPDADAIVTGIRVPGPFDGIELVRRLRADDRTRNKPIVVVTACVYEPDQQRARSAGANVFLPKPCLPETLAAEIRTALMAAPARREPVQVGLRRTKRNVA